MQSCLLNFNLESPLSANQMRIKIGIATPTPTTMGKGYRVIPIGESINNTTCQLCKHFDGFYDVYSLQREKPSSSKLMQFLQITKNFYQLTDYEALGILEFFRHKTSEAIEHLYNDGSRSKMHLEIDRPWRLQTKSIGELPGVRQFSNFTTIRFLKKSYFANPKADLNVLPLRAMAERFAGRVMRVQRIFYDNLCIMVAWALDDDYAPLEIASVLMPAGNESDWVGCNSLIDHLGLCSQK